MFKRIDSAADALARDTVTLTVDGKAVSCRRQDTVAAVLLAQGMDACRTTPVSGAARGPYCMMGVCFDCLVNIDGRPNQQGCMTQVRAGMDIQRQDGARQVGP